MKKIFINLILLLVTMLLILITLETILRLMPLQINQNFENFNNDKFHRISKIDGVGYELIPNISISINTNNPWKMPLRTNSYGFRGKELGKKTNNTIRILVIGDSVTFGPQTPENKTFQILLQTLLNDQNKDINYEVINAGVVGFAPSQEIALLKGRGLQVEPDLIILAFCLSNDFMVPMIINYSTDEYIHTLVINTEPIPYSILSKSWITEWFMEKSISYRFINIKYNIILKKLNIYDHNQDYYNIGYKDTKTAFEDLAEISKEKEISTIIIGLPWDVNRFGEMKEGYKYYRNNLIAKHFAKNAGLPYYDLTKTFYTSNRTRKELWYDGLHFGIEGHKIVADTLYDILSNDTKKLSLAISHPKAMLIKD